MEVEITGLTIFFLYSSLGWVMAIFGSSFGIIFLLVLDSSFRELLWVLPSGRWFAFCVRNSIFHKIIAFVTLCMFSVENAALKPVQHLCMDVKGSSMQLLPGHLGGCNML